MAINMGRMGPIYDYEGLAKTISSILDSSRFEAEFYGVEPKGVPVCQGDVLKIQSKFPYIDESARAFATEHPCGLWQVLGNTCDLTRPSEKVGFTQIAPVVPLQQGADISKFRQYKNYRSFYLPPTDSLSHGQHYATDLTRPVTLHKEALTSATVEQMARLSANVWVLFHCVLVRFLARDDGRFD